jgi:hypothetical protein
VFNEMRTLVDDQRSLIDPLAYSLSDGSKYWMIRCEPVLISAVTAMPGFKGSGSGPVNLTSKRPDDDTGVDYRLGSTRRVKSRRKRTTLITPLQNERLLSVRKLRCLHRLPFLSQPGKYTGKL